MAELTLKSRIIFRKDSAAGWSTSNPILKEGEPGWDSSNKRLKIGNGINAWSDLKEAFPDPAIYTGTGITIPDNSDDTIKFGFYGNMNLFNLSTTAFYPQLANCSLGTSTQGWYTSYVEKYLSKSNTAMTFGFADGTTAFSVGRSPAAIVPSNVVNNLGISSNPWTSIYIGNRSGNANDVISLTYNSLAIGTGNGALETTTSKDRTFTIWNKLIGPGPGGSYTWRNDVAIRTGCNTGGMYYDKTYIFAADKGFYATKMSGDNGANSVNGLNLGTSENPWNKLYLGDMQLSYNSTEEAIEFLAN